MLQPEPLHLENLVRLLTRPDAVSQRSSRQSLVLAENQGVDSLLESLIPEGVSPAKRAVIERLIALWVADSKLDVA